MHNAEDILSKYEEANKTPSRQQILEAMQEYADLRVKQTYDILISNDDSVSPVFVYTLQAQTPQMNSNKNH